MANALDNGQNVNLDLKYAKDLVWSKCNGTDFYKAIRFKVLPKLAYGLPKDEVVLMDSMICAKCDNTIASMADLIELPSKTIIFNGDQWNKTLRYAQLKAYTLAKAEHLLL